MAFISLPVANTLPPNVVKNKKFCGSTFQVAYTDDVKEVKYSCVV
jgi:hypothetical protein